MDETYKNAGKKSKRGVKKPRRRGRKGRGRGTYAMDKPPIFTLCSRSSGTVVYRAHRRATKNVAKLVVRRHVKPGSTVFTDSYEIYDWLDRSRLYSHDAVNHSAGEYVRGCVHINGAEGANQRLKEFLLERRGVAKSSLDGYCATASFWANRCVWSPREAFLDMIQQIFVPRDQPKKR